MEHDTWSPDALSSVLAGALEAAAPAVVRVEGRRGYPLSGTVWSAELVVTTRRAVEGADRLRVGTHRGDVHGAALVGHDPTTDLAVLRVDVGELEPPTWTAGDDLRVGHLVLMAGRPGQHVRASLGILTAVEGPWTTGAGGSVDRFVLPGATPFPGFSGGPLVTVHGEVIGVDSAALSRETPMTVPTSTVRRVVEALVAHGRIRQGYIGIQGETVRLPEEVQAATGRRRGLLIVRVVPGGPAAAAGLTLGDTLLSLDGDGVRRPDHLSASLGDDFIGRTVTIEYLRGGRVHQATVTVAERPADGG